MPQFNIRENGFNEIKKKLWLRTFIIMTAAVTTGIVISLVNSGQQKNEVNVLPVVIPFMAAFIGYRMWAATKKLKQVFDSYRLTVEDGLITREQPGLAALSISVIGIREIIKNKDGGFVIKGLNATDIIYVPAQIEQAAILESLLNSLHPVTIKTTTPFLQKYIYLFIFAILALMLGVYTSMNKIIVAVSGTSLIAVLGYFIYEIQRGKNYDKKVKRSAWWMLLVLLSAIGVMLVKLTGWGI